jgi:hypothetical protein
VAGEAVAGEVSASYAERRREIEARFATGELIADRRKVADSPSGMHRLTLDYYQRGPGTWAYSRGVVSDTRTGRVIADVKRNFSHFWYSWVNHANGNEYLLCGEDYQGQTVVNLASGRVRSCFPESGFAGHGFCWTAAYPSPDSRTLAVEGCYWACPYDVVFFDFSTPDELPYRELHRMEGLLGECVGWTSADTFEFTQEVDVRASDSKPYNELSDEEQAKVDATPGSLTTLKRRVTVDRRNFPAPATST